jgi:hypothetical protein
LDRNNQDDAEHHLLRENINADKRHSHAHNGDDQRTEYGPAYASSASGDRGSSDDNGRLPGAEAR